MPPSDIGIVGNDVPRQILWATGVTPRRLTGSWGVTPSAEAVELLGAVDAPVAGILTALLSAEATALDALVICNDSQSHLRLFYVLRMLTDRGLPPVRLLDLPRQDGPATRTFARVQLDRLIRFCSEVTGATPNGVGWRDAAERERVVGDAVARLRRRRRAVPAEVSGTAALTALLTAASVSPDEAVAVLDHASGDVDPAALRVFAAGSGHPDPSVYAELERGGVVVVGESHDTGDLSWFSTAVDANGIDAILDGLVDAHFARSVGSAVSTVADSAAATVTGAAAARADAVLALVRAGDEAPLWDLAATRAALANDGRPLVTRVGIAGSGPDAADLARELRSLEGTAA